MTLDWYCLAVFAKNEYAVQRETRDLGFQVFFPVQRRNRVIRRRKVQREYPLFPGYIFVMFDVKQDAWGDILETDGVIDFLKGGDRPSRVPASLVEHFMRAERAGAFDYTVPTSSFKLGDDVEIKTGPFAGLIARIKNANAKKRVQIVLKILGGETTLSIDACDLAKVG